MSERVKLADATLASGPASGDNIIMERNGAIMRVSEVASAAQATADGNGNDIASTYARNQVGAIYAWDGGTSFGWAKVASRTLTELPSGYGGNPLYAVFQIEDANNAPRQALGTLGVTVRVDSASGGNAAVHWARVMWATVTDGITLPGAAIVYDADANPGTAELWVYTQGSFSTAIVKLLYATNCQGADDSANWEFFKTAITGNGETDLPSDRTVVKATVGTLQNGVAATSLAVQSLSANGGGHFGFGPFTGQDRKRPDGCHPGRVERVAQGITARWLCHCA